MPSNPPPDQQQAQQRQQQAVRLLAEILAAGVAASAVLALVAAILAPFGVGAKAAGLALRLALSRPLRPKPAGLGVIAVPGAAKGPARAAEDQAAASFRAAYLLAAARRIEAGLRAGRDERALLEAERRNLDAHLGAQARRAAAAKQVDDMAGSTGQTGRVLLGWSAEDDERTTPECRWADGKNFYADQRPVFGWPGAVHPYCRCRPVPPWPGGRLLYAAPSRLLRGH